MLRNFPELVYRRTGVKAQLADDALFCVAKGTGIALEHLDVYKNDHSEEVGEGGYNMALHQLPFPGVLYIDIIFKLC